MAKIRKMHTARIMVLIDNTWRPAIAVANTYSGDTGNIDAMLNGLVITVKGGSWYNLDDTMTDEQITANAIQQNIDQLFQVAANKAVHRKTQEMIARQREQDALAAANPQPAPVVEQPPVVLRDPDDDLDDYYEPMEFGECDCEDCQRARGEL